jgi:hypothetical protein
MDLNLKRKPSCVQGIAAEPYLFFFRVFCRLAFGSLISVLSVWVWSNPIRFPDVSVYALFFGSSIVAAFSCFIIGLDYIGLGLKPKHKPKQARPIRKPQTVELQARLETAVSVPKPKPIARPRKKRKQ